MLKLKIIILLFIQILFAVKDLKAQDSVKFKFVDAHELTLEGRGISSSNNYHRLDSIDRIGLPPRVQKLSRNSAGLNINFKTNAKKIKLEWELAKWMDIWNMTPLAVNGLDLYCLNNGTWQYVSSARPSSVKNSVTLIDNLDGGMKQFKLYLPLYTEINSIKIGVQSSDSIQKVESKHVPKKVVIYGSSITQGASASRPGMAYPSILSRKMGIETINLGFSGNGKMELDLVNVLAKIPADVYILDCVPNPNPKQIKERAYPFINKLRALKPGVPIIMVESIYRETGYWNNSVGTMVKEQNEEFKRTYEKLMKDKPTNLYYIPSANLIGHDHEATTDGTHLTDVGFMRIADEVSKFLYKALSK